MEIKEKELWRTIEGYENYQISSMGRVKSLKYGKDKILKQNIIKNYCMVCLHKEGKKKHYLVHRLVATAFLPNPDNLPQVNHKDENKQNNCVENLEFCTAKYNSNYGTRLERCSIAHKGRKQSQEHIEKCAKARQKPILQLSKSGNIILGKWDSISQASKILGIDITNIIRCCKGKLKSCGGFKWKYLQDYKK